MILVKGIFVAVFFSKEWLYSLRLSWLLGLMNLWRNLSRDSDFKSWIICHSSHYLFIVHIILDGKFSKDAESVGHESGCCYSKEFVLSEPLDLLQHNFALWVCFFKISDCACKLPRWKMKITRSQERITRIWDLEVTLGNE